MDEIPSEVSSLEKLEQILIAQLIYGHALRTTEKN